MTALEALSDLVHTVELCTEHRSDIKSDPFCPICRSLHRARGVMADVDGDKLSLGDVWMSDNGPRPLAEMTAGELRQVVQHLMRDIDAARDNFRKLAEVRK